MSTAPATRVRGATGPIDIARFRREIREVMVWEAVLTGSMMLVVPFAVNAALYGLLRLAHPDDLVLWGGGVTVLLPQLLSGIFFGVWLVPRVIRLRFPPSRAEAMIALYVESEEAKYGRLGRFVVQRAGPLSLLLLLLPLLFAADRFTLVDARRVEYGQGMLAAQRVTLPHEDVVRVLELRRRSSRDVVSRSTYYVVYRDGRVLSSRSSLLRQGELSSLPRQGEAAAAAAIARGAGQEIERRVLAPGEPCPEGVGDCP